MTMVSNSRTDVGPYSKSNDRKRGYSADDRDRGHFEGERVGTPFPLLKCLRTHKTRLKLRKKIKTVLDSYLMPNQES